MTTRVFPVIATRGRPAELQQQLGGLLAQLGAGERVIVVIDGCAATEAALAEPKHAGDERLQIVGLSRQVGVDCARRLGNSLVPCETGDIVCEIDDHDYAQPGLLVGLRKVFAERWANYAWCDVVISDPGGHLTKPRVKQEGNFKDCGNLGYGMRAYRKWLYDAVGGYPLDYFPANDLALMCRIEQLCEFKGGVYLREPLVRVTVTVTGISLGQVHAQEEAVAKVQSVSLNGGFKLPFTLISPHRRTVAPTRVIPPGAPMHQSDVSQEQAVGDTVVPATVSPLPIVRPMPPAPPPSPLPSLTKPPHLLLVTEFFGVGRGGGEISMLKCAKAVAESGYRVSALYSKDAGATPYDQPWVSLYKHREFGLRTREASQNEKFRAFLQKLNPDVVVSEVWVGANIAEACRDLGYPLVTLVQFWRNIVPLTDEGFAALDIHPIPRERLDEEGCMQLRKSKALVPNSEFTAGVIRDALGREPEVVVYPPLRRDDIASGDAPLVKDREYVTCPSVQWRKGSKIFLELARRNPSIKFLLLAGDNRHSREADVMGIAESLPNVDIRHEWVDDMRQVYAQTRCLFIGTLTCESFCKAAAEARANGIPLLVSAVGNLPNMIVRKSGVGVARGASIDKWDAGLKKALSLRPQPTAKFCQDNRYRFVETLNKYRRLSDVAAFKVSAPGVTTGLNEFAATFGMQQLTWPPEIEKAEPYNLVLIPGLWMDTFSRTYKGKMGFWWCSHFAQMDTNRREVRELDQVVKDVKAKENRVLFLTSEPDVAVWKPVLGDRVLWLPNAARLAPAMQAERPTDSWHVFIPGPYVQRKNTLTSLAAIAAVGAEAHVTARVENRNRELLELAQALGVKVHVHDCPERADVLKAISECHAALVLSTAETYSFAALESVEAGVATIGWEGVPVLRGSEWLVKDPTDVGDASRMLNVMLGSGAWRNTGPQYEAVRQNVEHRNEAAHRALVEAVTR